jgi:hypothetical protein
VQTEVVGFFKILAPTHQTTWCHNPKDHNQKQPSKKLVSKWFPHQNSAVLTMPLLIKSLVQDSILEFTVLTALSKSKMTHLFLLFRGQKTIQSKVLVISKHPTREHLHPSRNKII